MPGPVFRQGERLTLRLVQPDDYGFLIRHWNDMPVRHQCGWPQEPGTDDDVAAVAERDDTVNFLACHDDTPVGHVWLFDFDWEARNAELVYMIIPDEQGNGYATEAANLCLTHAFDELGLHRVSAKVYEDNEGSKRVLEKLGFQQEGVFRNHVYIFGDYADGYWFGLLESER